MVGIKSRARHFNWLALLGLSLLVSIGCQTSTDTLRDADEVTQGRDKRSPSDEVTDLKLLEAVRAAYAADPTLAGVVVQTECYRRVIVLKGQVATQDIERRLIKLANGVAGVTVVASRLKVVGAN